MDHGTLSVAGVSPRSSLAVRRVTPLIKYLVRQSASLPHRLNSIYRLAGSIRSAITPFSALPLGRPGSSI